MPVLAVSRIRSIHGDEAMAFRFSAVPFRTACPLHSVYLAPFDAPQDALHRHRQSRLIARWLTDPARFCCAAGPASAAPLRPSR